MSLYIDVKYVLRLSSRLEHFKQKNQYLWNCRCPLCGDSSTSKSKARGYIYRDKRDGTKLAFKCHNCLRSVLISTLIKQLDPELYREYKLERFRNPESHIPTESPTPAKASAKEVHHFLHAVRCDRLPPDHVCRLYLQSRCIPHDLWNRLYYADNYVHFIDELFPDHGKKDLQEDARLIIPYFDQQGRILAVTGRALTDDGIRYITIRANDSPEKLVFGLDRLDEQKHVYVVEGPLDSLFLPNAVASGDANLVGAAERLTARHVTLIFDNERRNREVIHQIEKAIKLGYPVCIWPDTVHEKDINQMIQNGRSPTEICEIIDSHTVSGLSALVTLNFWKRLTPNTTTRSVCYGNK